MENSFHKSLSTTLLKKFIDHNFKLATIESFTGGAFAAEIVKISGASQFFQGALVAYNNDIKEKIGIDTSQGVINAQVAKAMALQGKKYFNATHCISFTGNAGPNNLDHEPVGKIFIALNEKVYQFQWNNLSRNEIISKAVSFAIDLLENLF